MTLHA